MQLVQQQSSAYELNCCGQRTVLQEPFASEVERARQQFGGDLTKAVLRSFTGDACSSPAIRALKTNENLEACGAWIWAVTSAIKSRCRSHGKTSGHVYRGAAVPRDFLNNFRNNGSIVMFPAFISGSTSRSMAEHFAEHASRCVAASVKVLLVIDCDNADDETYFTDISELSYYQAERETVFVPYTGFEVMGCCVSGDFWVVTVRPCDQKQMAQRAERFAWHPGSTGVLERSLLYDQNCCGQRKDLQGEFASEVARLKKDFGYAEGNALLRSYTVEKPNLYKQANTALKENAKLESHGGYIWALKQAIKRRFADQGKTTGHLYRGVAAPNTVEVLNALQTPGRKFVFPAFTSASKDEQEARTFASRAYDGPGKQRVLFIIDTDAEIGLSYYVDIEDISESPHESETLFFPYSGFEVMGSYWESEDRDFLIVNLRPYDQQMICSQNAV